ncbi:TetR/AcrR family transcriptional regulator [Variovorax defluvii]|uniref:TetR/AcrR family transcriptional regulator n=1 Tax=Variovorax defluvii TaxID=913761 RepID=A0ABP8HEY9_9BURK
MRHEANTAERWGSALLPSPDEQRLAKRQALMRQAAMAFRERGFYATSMEHIATALGVTKGALYRYISNKQEILFECFLSSSRIGDAALEVAASTQGSGLRKLSAFIVHFVTHYLEHNTAGGAMVDIDALFPEQRQQIIAGRDRVDRELRRYVMQGIEDGSIVTRDHKLAELTLMGSINWIPSWYTPGGRWTPRDVAEAVAEIFVRGLQASSAPAVTSPATPSAEAGKKARTPKPPKRAPKTAH